MTPAWRSIHDDAHADNDDSCERVGCRRRGNDAWEAGHRMPFVVRWPGKVEPGSVNRQVTSFTDLLATFAAILDTDLPRDAGEDSFNVLPVLLGDQPDDQPSARLSSFRR